jgi:uncharacterized protein
MKKVMIKILLMTIAFLVNSFSFSVADVQKNLRRAAIDGNIAMAQEALSLGADINKPDRLGGTALMLASMKGNVQMIEFLLNAGAHIDAKSKVGLTALMFASHANHPAAVALLLARGADIWLTNSRDQTALDIAKKEDNMEAAKVIEDFIEKKRKKRRKEVSEEILKTRPETYPAITEEIAEFEIGK